MKYIAEKQESWVTCQQQKLQKLKKKPKTTTKPNPKHQTKTTQTKLKVTYIDFCIHEQQRVPSITPQLCVAKLPKDI